MIKTQLKSMLFTAALVTNFVAVTAIAGSGHEMGKSEHAAGGAVMDSNKDIIDNAVNSKDHTTLVTAIKAAGLVETLKGKGPFTVFAPTNEAFAKLPKGTVEGLLKPESQKTLSGILTYHVVPGAISAKSLTQLIKDNNGKATVKTVQGESFVAEIIGSGVVLIDSKGNKANVTVADLNQSNGVIHVIDTVLMP